MKNKLTVAASALALTVAISTSLSIVSVADTRTAGKSSALTQTYDGLVLFGDVFEQVRQNYVEPVEDKKLIEYALNGMLTNLDPHSNYMSVEETRAMAVQNRGEFGGLGIEITMENGVVKVVSPIDDTPASRAGMQAGDLIVEIDGKQVMGMTLNEAVEQMRGRVGTDVLITVVREGAPEPLKIKLTRDTIQIRSVKSRLESGNVGYIRMSAFNSQTFPGLKKAFTDLTKESGGKLVGYVLDLRNNPGGLLDQAIMVSDAFLDKGEIVSTRGRNPEDMRRDIASPGDLANGLPVVVLVNGGSASASEIVAGALQDHKRAIVMGTQSFGKGSVQTLLDVPGGGSIKLTTARYYTPSGTSIQAKGITPDIIVERAKVVEEKSKFGEIHEADLKGALSNGIEQKKEDVEDPTLMPEKKDGTDTNAKTKDGKDDKSAETDDYQLLRAIDLLQGISLYRQADAAGTVSNDNKGTP